MPLSLTPAATLIVLTDTADGIKTLLLQRQSKASFLPGAWVFPGGIVETQDTLKSQEHNHWLSARYAASRETAEESGLQLQPEQFVPFSRWLAPKEAEKRFDTYFFLAQCTTQNIHLQAEEVSQSLWISPANAIEKHHQQQLKIIPPTLVSLELLKDFETCNEALQHYQQQAAIEFVPKVHFWQDQVFMLYHGDVAYDTFDMREHGPYNRCQLIDGAWHYTRQA